MGLIINLTMRLKTSRYFERGKDMEIKIIDEVGENCITPDDGALIYGKIHPVLKNEGEVTLDFSGVEVFASPFFNAAIGHLLKDIDVEALRKHLNVIGLASAGREVWDRVIENSKQYFSADEQTRKAMDDIIRGHSEGD